MSSSLPQEYAVYKYGENTPSHFRFSVELPLKDTDGNETTKTLNYDLPSLKKLKYGQMILLSEAESGNVGSLYQVLCQLVVSDHAEAIKELDIDAIGQLIGDWSQGAGAKN